MKKIMLSLLVVGIVAVALGTASIVNAQSPTQQPFYGQGGNGRQGNRVSDDLRVVNEPLHDLMLAAWSTELGLTVDVLDTRIDAGETMAEIAISTGLSIEDFWTLKTEIHTSVAKEALAQGLITQAQADWMCHRPDRAAAWVDAWAAVTAACAAAGFTTAPTAPTSNL